MKHPESHVGIESSNEKAIISSKLEQGSRKRREWLKSLGFTRRERLGMVITDSMHVMLAGGSIEPVTDAYGDVETSQYPSDARIRQRQLEIQEWADAVRAGNDSLQRWMTAESTQATEV